MKKLNKILFVPVLTAIIMVMLLTGCSGSYGGRNEEKETDTDKINVVATLFPYYDFVRSVAGDRIHLSMVVPAGMDSHSFEPTPADMLTIQNADVLICNGGALEHWLTQVLDAVDTTGMTVMTGMDYVDTVKEEIVEGMEDEEHDHDHDSEGHDLGSGDYDLGSGDDGHGVEIEYDEHIWTSPVNAMTLVKEITAVLSDADPKNASYYEENRDVYLEKLKQLDNELLKVAANGKRSMIIVGDKFPYRYLADEYGLSYRAAFSGCSTDTEPSAKTIAYLIDKIRSEHIPVIYYLELSSHRVSEIISEETGAEPLLLHSCHNVTRKEFDDGVTYLDLMEQNVINLRKGLDE